MLVPSIPTYSPAVEITVPLWERVNISIEELDEALIALRKHKGEQINQWREAANNTWFPYKGKRFACDKLSRSDIEGTQGQIMNRGEIPDPSVWAGGWKAIDNTFITINTVEEWHAFYEAMFVQGAKNFAKSQYLKQVVASTGTIQEILNLTWDNVKTPYDAIEGPLA